MGNAIFFLTLSGRIQGTDLRICDSCSSFYPPVLSDGLGHLFVIADGYGRLVSAPLNPRRHPWDETAP